MSEPMTPAEEAAAFWGAAENQAFPVEQRLACALQALEFFGGAYDRVQELAEKWENDPNVGTLLHVALHDALGPESQSEGGTQ